MAKRASPAPKDARQRIDETAYKLFCRHGARAVGIDTIIERSGVAKMTLYRHYPSKDDLIVSFIERRWNLFATAWAADVQRRGRTPQARLLAVFDALHAWFREPDFFGCPVLRILFEEDPRSPAGKGVAKYLDGLHAFVLGLAREARLSDPERLARQWLLLIKGAVVAAYAGDKQAAPRAKEMAEAMLQHAQRKRRSRRS